MIARVTQDVMQYKQTVPDYDAAFQHAVKVRQEELALFGNSQEVIARQLDADVRALIAQAYSQGKNPGELFYNYAKMRGYAGPAPQAPSQAATQVQALAEAQRQTQTIGTAGGPSSDGGMTIEMLAKMSEAELMALPPAKRDAYMRTVMGG
ncbi:MAG: hypothetical protein HC889_12630 [Synechococcaceae cyanobacterium SM1_2_3]|nr:hypothetical protein [Synechococcaceae cyanobacterium SM1_2_3]